MTELWIGLPVDPENLICCVMNIYIEIWFFISSCIGALIIYKMLLLVSSLHHSYFSLYEVYLMCVRFEGAGGLVVNMQD